MSVVLAMRSGCYHGPAQGRKVSLGNAPIMGLETGRMPAPAHPFEQPPPRARGSRLMVHEVDEELREIKREIIESRGLVIKTNNLTNALSADIRSIAKRQQQYERRITWNSATSYVVFVLVVFASLKLAMDARLDQLKGENAQREKDVARLRDELTSTKEHERDRQNADERAAKFYELVRQGKRNDLIAQWEQLKTQPLSKAEAAMFGDAV